MNTPSVYLVDDDASFLTAFTRALRLAGLQVSGFASAREALLHVSPASRGCVVTDLSMPVMSGLELQKELVRREALLPVLFLTGHGDISSSVHAMREGAADFLEKNASQEQVLAAIQKAFERDATAHAAREKQCEARRRLSRLTPRENEVLVHMLKGQMNKQIAATLGISVRTVKLHRASLRSKVGLHSGAQLAVLAHEAGMAATL
jgi:FixJ family two-component response regulator